MFKVTIVTYSHDFAIGESLLKLSNKETNILFKFIITELEQVLT